MTLLLTFWLLCDGNSLFIVKRIAGMPYFHKPTERETSQLADFFKSILQLTLQLIRLSEFRRSDKSNKYVDRDFQKSRTLEFFNTQLWISSVYF